MLLPPKNGGISMTFTNTFYNETTLEMASSCLLLVSKMFS